MAKDKGYNRRVETSSESISINKTNSNSPITSDLLYGRKNYILILTGLGLIFLGLALMSGGHQPSPDVWDESLIYSFRRITLAPIVIIAGLVIEIYAIFAEK